MTFTYYTCKNCGTYSSEMELIKPTKKLEDEKLKCKCGKICTWANMNKNTS